MICCKRVYEPCEEADGYRVLVDRLWPQGMPKDQLHHDQWLREVVPCVARAGDRERVGAALAASPLCPARNNRG